MKKTEAKKVIRGKGRGKRLGFPTLNFPLEKDEKIKRGVWVIVLETKNGSFPGVANVGRPETFLEKKEAIESHLLFHPQETIKEAKIIFLKYLRKTIKFNDTNGLKKQIKKDIERAISFFRKERKKARTLNIPSSF
ncbi:riboflavin kinase [bacterium]|nr:riboflavin kinase [bacterium]